MSHEHLSNAASLKRPGPDQPLADVNVAQLVAVSLRLAMEVSVLRDRLRTHEALLARHGLLDAAAVDAYAPTAEENRERDAFKRGLVEALAADIDPKAG